MLAFWLWALGFGLLLGADQTSPPPSSPPCRPEGAPVLSLPQPPPAPYRSPEPGTLALEAGGVRAALRLLDAEEEARFFETFAGRRLRLFTVGPGRCRFYVFAFSLRNDSSEPLFFNPGYVSLEARGWGGWSAIEVTDALAYLRARFGEEQARSLQPFVERVLWALPVRLAPGESPRGLLVFPVYPPRMRAKEAVLECSWLTLGEKDLELRFPLQVAPLSRKERKQALGGLRREGFE